MIRESAKVTYIGMDVGEGPSLGDQGRVISADGGVCHVLWSTGAVEHQVTAHYDSDLSLAGHTASADGLEDSLEVGGLVTFSVRNVYDSGGSPAVVNQMAEMGHLGAFSEYAEEAIALVAARVRQDPSVRAVTANLEEDEAEHVYRLASACLIRDAFGVDDE